MVQKKKRLTQREKGFRAEVKKQLQAEGVLPPNKARLNRKQFARDVWAEFEAMEGFHASVYLRKAIGCMVGPNMREIDAEQVGILKLLKIAVETERFMKSLEAEGRSEYTIEEYIDNVVLPIIKL